MEHDTKKMAKEIIPDFVPPHKKNNNYLWTKHHWENPGTWE